MTTAVRASACSTTLASAPRAVRSTAAWIATGSAGSARALHPHLHRVQGGGLGAGRRNASAARDGDNGNDGNNGDNCRLVRDAATPGDGRSPLTR